MAEEEGYYDLEQYYMFEIEDQECPEVYRDQNKKLLVLSVKKGAWVLNEEVFFSYQMTMDCDMEWIIVLHAFVPKYTENELTPIQLAQLRGLCRQWAKENGLHFYIDYGSEGAEEITWPTGGKYLRIDEMLLRYYVEGSTAFQNCYDEDGKKNVEQFVKRVRADLQTDVDAILEKR